MKSGNFNFLEPSGPLQAYNGTDLPLPLYIYIYIYNTYSVAEKYIRWYNNLKFQRKIFTLTEL